MVDAALHGTSLCRPVLVPTEPVDVIGAIGRATCWTTCYRPALPHQLSIVT